MGYRQKLIKIVTFLGGIYFFLEFILPKKIGAFEFGAYHDYITNGFITVGTMAVGLGLINLLRVHGSKIVFRRKGWGNSSALLIGLFAMLCITGIDWKANLEIRDQGREFFILRDFAGQIVQDAKEKKTDVPKLSKRLESFRTATIKTLNGRDRELNVPSDHPEKPLAEATVAKVEDALQETRQTLNQIGTDESALELLPVIAGKLSTLGVSWQELQRIYYRNGLQRKFYDLLYQGLFVALGSAMFSLLGFYIAAAAYRAFRVRSAESGLMIGAAIIVMLGQIPFGIWIWEGFPELRLWILQIPNAAAFRAIKFGAAVAGLIMAFRMWFSIESESFHEEGKNASRSA